MYLQNEKFSCSIPFNGTMMVNVSFDFRMRIYKNSFQKSNENAFSAN